MQLSIIIPVYNSKKYLGDCLSSIFGARKSNMGIETIIVDNASTDGTEDVIKKNYPFLRYIRNTFNKGSAAARNQGITEAKGEFLMFLDSDAYLDKNFFIKLKSILISLPEDVGALAAKVINVSTKKIFSCGLKISSIYRVYDVGRGRKTINFSRPFMVDGPNSCCGIYRRETLEKAKEKVYFDEDFFFLFEDADLALRMKKKGYKCLFVPELACYHYGGGSGISGEYRRFLCFRNRIFMILKYQQGEKLMCFLLKSFFYDLPRTFHFVLTNRYFLRTIHDICNYRRKVKSYRVL